MGIPFYFKKIADAHPGVVHHTLKRAGSTKEKRLYLDFNGVIHQCAQLVKKNGVKASKFEASLVDAVWAYTLRMVDIVEKALGGELDMVFLGVDGPAPMAKVVQQRKRRYLSVWEKRLSAGVLRDHGHPDAAEEAMGGWDSNAITPGTPFMNMLMERLAVLCKSKPRWVLSSSNDAGEGEHKIIDHMMKHPRGENCIDVVYGLDADLIMLTMLQHGDSGKQGDIVLMRESQQYDRSRVDKGEFVFVHIPMLYDALMDQLVHVYGWNRDLEHRLIHEYIAMCFLLGNDFVPHLSFLSIGHGGIEVLSRAVGLLHKQGMVLVQCEECEGGGAGNKLQTQGLRYVLGSLYTNEGRVLSEQHNGYMADRFEFRFSHKNPVRSASTYVRMYPKMYKDKETGAIEYLKSGWQKRYYEVLFGESDSQFVSQCTVGYIHMLQWCVHYYMNRVYNDELVYTHAHSPTMYDVHNTLVATACDPPAGVRDKPVSWNSPAEPELIERRLLLVLPPQSIRSICPDKMRYVQDVRHGMVTVFPYEYKVGTYMKTWGWECAPLGIHDVPGISQT